jgi:hypothetical protein
MYIPCATCKDQGRCADEEITTREAVFAYVGNAAFDCADRRENSIVEGCFDTHIYMDSGGRLPAVRNGRVLHYGAPLFLGAR